MYAGVKRIADVLVSLCGLIVLSPLYGVLVLLIRMDSPGSALFKQKRIGRNGTFFSMYKFRTMRNDTPRDLPTHLLGDGSRYVTRTGRFLRKSSMDELPQLFNILKGDMSLVGPRPALWNQDDLQACRIVNGSHAIRPGLTGWAQVNGRDELSIERKAELDGYYAAHAGPLMDLRVIARTVVRVFYADGIVDGNGES